MKDTQSRLRSAGTAIIAARAEHKAESPTVAGLGESPSHASIANAAENKPRSSSASQNRHVLQIGRGWFLAAVVWTCVAPVIAGLLAFRLSHHFAQSSSIRPALGMVAIITTAITVHVLVESLKLCSALRAVSMAAQPTSPARAVNPAS